jgi:hypothetical protein
VAVFLLPAAADAQVLQEILNSQVIEATSNPFSCIDVTGGAAVPCNLYNRMYSELNPNIINANGGEQGHPRYRGAKTKFEANSTGSGNFPGVNSVSDACEPWYSVWTGVSSPADSPTFVTYYAASSQILNGGEGGGPLGPDWSCR